MNRQDNELVLIDPSLGEEVLHADEGRVNNVSGGDANSPNPSGVEEHLLDKAEVSVGSLHLRVLFVEAVHCHVLTIQQFFEMQYQRNQSACGLLSLSELAVNLLQ